MQNFNSDLDIRYLNGDDYLLLNDFIFYYYSDVVNGKYLASIKHLSEKDRSFYVKTWFVIPKGFITDFASVPSILQGFLPKTGRHGKAAVVHDYLFRTAGQNIRLYDPSDDDDVKSICATDLTYDKFYTSVDFKESNQIFKIAMEILGVKTWRKNLFYLGVKLWGNKVYQKYRERNHTLLKFENGVIVKPLDFRLTSDIIPVYLTIDTVERNLLTFIEIKGTYLNYNFKHPRQDI